LEKTTLWVTKNLRNELMKLKFDTNNTTIEDLINEMLSLYKKQKECSDGNSIT